MFANKGGGMRKVAKRMRDKADKLSEDIVSVRREDESLTKFEFPYTSPYDNGPLMEISMLSTRCSSTGDMLHKKLRTGNVRLVKGSRLHIKGPNGIGKTTLLELLVKKTQPGLAVENGVKIGYYRQDFHNFDFESTVIECLETSAGSHSMQVRTARICQRGAQKSSRQGCEQPASNCARSWRSERLETRLSRSKHAAPFVRDERQPRELASVRAVREAGGSTRAIRNLNTLPPLFATSAKRENS